MEVSRYLLIKYAIPPSQVVLILITLTQSAEDVRSFSAQELAGRIGHFGREESEFERFVYVWEIPRRIVLRQGLPHGDAVREEENF
jgi:hypothetical protein